MLRPLVAATVLASTAFAVAATVTSTEPLGSADRAPRPSAIAERPLCEQLWQREPLVVYDVSGSTLIGPVLMHLVVYNDGQVSLSESVPFTGTSRVEQADIGPAEALALAADLAEAGAFDLCDEEGLVLDIPMTTVTVFRGRVAHTFNYWIGGGDHGAVHALLSGFIQSTFPN